MRRCGGVLEHRVAVAEGALRGVQGESLAGLQVDGVERLEAILQFHTVGADVLHRGGAHGAGNERHVLQPRPALLQRPAHGLVPAFAAAHLHDPGARGVFHQPAAGDFDLEHHRLDVTGQHDVAAATQHEFRCRAEFGIGQHGQHIRLAFDPDQGMGAGDDAEGVVRLEWDVFLD